MLKEISQQILRIVNIIVLFPVYDDVQTRLYEELKCVLSDITTRKARCKT